MLNNKPVFHVSRCHLYLFLFLSGISAVYVVESKHEDSKFIISFLKLNLKGKDKFTHLFT